jgi:hypothetical protein
MKRHRIPFEQYQDDRNFDECSTIIAIHVTLYSLLYFFSYL